MAVLSGLIPRAVLHSYENSYISTDLANHAGESDLARSPSFYTLAVAAREVVTSRLPVSCAPRIIGGLPTRSYSSDFYDRIHLSHSAIELGNVVGTQTTRVTVWNAFTRPKNLIEVAGMEEGITLEAPQAMPFSFPPLL